MTDATIPEEWRVIESFPGYEVSSRGRVRNCRTNQVLRPWFHKGYAIVGLYNGPGKAKYLGIHKLVCGAFHGQKPTPRHEVAHEDGNSRNNECTNLSWKTRKENVEDTVRHGRTSKGSKAWNSRLSPEQVLEIRAAYKTGEITQEELGRRFGITRLAVHDIISGVTWGWLSPETVKIGRSTRRGERHPHARLSEANILEIKRLFAAGATQTQLAERFAVAISTIGEITRGKNWGWLKLE